jgi:hypothetical protein
LGSRQLCRHCDHGVARSQLARHDKRDLTAEPGARRRRRARTRATGWVCVSSATPWNTASPSPNCVGSNHDGPREPENCPLKSLRGSRRPPAGRTWALMPASCASATALTMASPRQRGDAARRLPVAGALFDRGLGRHLDFCPGRREVRRASKAAFAAVFPSRTSPRWLAFRAVMSTRGGR